MRILVFGASGGLGMKDTEDSGWVDRLKFYLAKKTDWKIQTYNLCVSGHGSSSLAEYMDVDCKSRIGQRHETMIIIDMGTNDAQTDKNGKWLRNDLKTFDSNMRKAIQTARKYTNKIILTGVHKVDESKTNPLPWHIEAHYKNSDIEKIASALRNISKEENVPFIEFGNLPLSDDGLHLNTEGHKKAFEMVKDFLIKNKLVTT